MNVPSFLSNFAVIYSVGSLMRQEAKTDYLHSMSDSRIHCLWCVDPVPLFSAPFTLAISNIHCHVCLRRPSCSQETITELWMEPHAPRSAFHLRDNLFGSQCLHEYLRGLVQQGLLQYWNVDTSSRMQL